MSDFAPVVQDDSQEQDQYQDQFSPVVQPPTQDQRQKTIASIKKVSKNPDEVEPSIQLGDHLSKTTGMSPVYIASNAEKVATAYFGKPTKPKEAVTRIGNYIKNTKIDQEIDRINGLYPLKLPPEAEAQIKTLEAQKEGKTLEGIPKTAADIFTGIGTYVVGLGQKADYAAAALSEDMQGLLAKGLETIGVDVNPDTADYHFAMGAKDAQEFTAVGIGAARRAQRAAGQGNVSGLITAEVLDIGNTAMAAFPAGRAKDALEVAYANTVAKVGLKGTVLKIGEIAGKQGAFGLAVSGWNNMVNQFGVELSNVAEKTHIPLKTLQEQAKEIGMNAIPMAVGGTVMEAGGMAMGGILSKLRGLGERADHPEEVPNAPEGTEAGVTAKGEVPPRSEPLAPTPEAVAKEAVDKMSVGEILDETPPEVHPQGAGTEKATPVEAIPSFSKYGETKPEKMMGVADEMKASLNPDSVSTPRISAMLDRAKLEFQHADSPEAWGEAEHRLQEAGRAMDKSFGGNSFASEMESAGIATKQEIETGISRETRSAMTTAKMPSITEQVEADPRYKAVQEKLTATREALDSARKQAGMQKADQIASLSEALDSARQEARMTEDNLKAEKIAGMKQSVVTERERVARRDSINKMVNYFKDLDPESFHDLGLKHDLEALKDLYTATKHTDKKLQGMKALAQEIRDNPDNYYDAKELDTLAELDRKPLRDLTPSELQSVYEAARHLKWLDSEKNSIKIGEEKQDFEAAKTKILGEMKKRETINAKREQGAPSSKTTVKGSLAKPREPILGIDLRNKDMFIRGMFDGGEDSTAYQVLQNAPVQGERVFETKKVDYAKHANDFYTEKKITPMKWGSEAQVIKGRTWDRDYRLAVYANSLHPLNRECLGKGFAFEDGDYAGVMDQLKPGELDEIISSITPEEKDLVQRLQAGYKKQGNDIAPVWFDVTGREFKQEEPYVPINRLPEGRSSVSPDEMADMIGKSRYTNPTTKSKHYISRVGGSGPIILRRFTKEYLEHGQDAALFVAQQRNIKAMMKLIRDPTFTKDVHLGYGKSAYKALIQHVQDIARTPLDFVNGIQRLRGLFIASALGGNIHSMVRLMALSIRSLNYTGLTPKGLAQWGRGVTDAMIHPRNSRLRAETYSPMYAANTLGLPEFSEALSSASKTPVGKAVAGAVKKSGQVVGKGFTIGMKYEMNVLREKAFDEIRDGKLSPDFEEALKLAKLPTDASSLKKLGGDDAEKYAYTYAEYAVQRTHATKLPEFGAVYAHANLFGYALSPFTSEGNVWLNQLFRTVDDAKRNGAVKTTGKALNWLIVGAVIAPLLDHAVDQAWYGAQGKKPPSQAETTARDVSELIPGGAEVEYTVDSMLKYHHQLGTSSIIGMEEIPNDMMTVISSITQAMTAKTPKSKKTAMSHALSSAVHLGGIAAGGIPTNTLRSYWNILTNLGKNK